MFESFMGILFSLINLFWALFLACFLCFMILMAFYSFKRGSLFRKDIEMRKPGEFIPAFYLFWFTSHFGFTVSYLVLQKTCGTASMFPSPEIFPAFLVLGVMVAGRALIHSDKARHAKTLMYGVVTWSLILLSISLYVDPFYYSTYFIPAMAIALLMLLFASPIEWASKYIAEKGKGKLKEIDNGS